MSSSPCSMLKWLREESGDFCSKSEFRCQQLNPIWEHQLHFQTAVESCGCWRDSVSSSLKIAETPHRAFQPRINLLFPDTNCWSWVFPICTVPLFPLNRNKASLAFQSSYGSSWNWYFPLGRFCEFHVFFLPYFSLQSCSGDGGHSFHPDFAYI